MNLVSGSIRFVRIFAGVSWTGVSNDSGLSKTAIFSTFARYFFRSVSGKANIIVYYRPIIQSLAAFTLTPKYMTLSDREILLCFVKFKICFFPYTESASRSILSIDNIFGEGHTR